jgi:hypothetical protein
MPGPMRRLGPGPPVAAPARQRAAASTGRQWQHEPRGSSTLDTGQMLPVSGSLSLGAATRSDSDSEPTRTELPLVLVCWGTPAGLGRVTRTSRPGSDRAHGETVTAPTVTGTLAPAGPGTQAVTGTGSVKPAEKYHWHWQCGADSESYSEAGQQRKEARPGTASLELEAMISHGGSLARRRCRAGQ